MKAFLHAKGCKFEERQKNGCDCKPPEAVEKVFTEPTTEERAAAYAAYVERQREQMVKKPPQRCGDCGVLLSLDYCVDHRSAEAVPWGKTESYAYRYLSGAEADEVIEEFRRRPELYPGVEARDLINMARLLRRWGGSIPEMGAQQQELVSPRGLFG